MAKKAEKDLGQELENLEQGVENLKNTEFKILGIKMTPVTIGAAFTLIGSIIGALYGAFTVYNDYMDMKEQIQSYTAPDLSGIEETLAVQNEKMIALEDMVIQSNDYIRDIRTDLKGDLTSVEQVAEEAENRVKEIQDGIDDTLREMEQLNRETEKDVRDSLRETEERIEADMRQLEDDLNEKLQEALDNPLNN